MPLFEYQCPACDVTFEQLVRGDTKVSCPSCGSSRVRKLLSIPAPPVSSTASSLGPCGNDAPPGGCCGGGMCQAS